MSISLQLKEVREQQERSRNSVATAAGIRHGVLRSAEIKGNATEKTLHAWAAALGYALVLIPLNAEISSATEAM